MSLLVSRANAGCVDGMRAMGRLAGVLVVTSANRMVRLGFPEVGRTIRIVILTGIIPFFQSGVMFASLNQG